MLGYFRFRTVENSNTQKRKYLQAFIFIKNVFKNNAVKKTYLSYENNRICKIIYQKKCFPLCAVAPHISDNIFNQIAMPICLLVSIKVWSTVQNQIWQVIESTGMLNNNHHPVEVPPVLKKIYFHFCVVVKATAQRWKYLR